MKRDLILIQTQPFKTKRKAAENAAVIIQSIADEEIEEIWNTH